jgi:hypothetical protein
MPACRVCHQEKEQPLFKRKGSTYERICKECDSRRASLWQKQNPERARAKYKKWVAENAERNRVITQKALRKYKARHPERVKEARAKYRASEKGRAKELAYGRAYRDAMREEMTQKKLAWMRANKERVNATTRKRYATKMNATPAWANEFFIGEAYELAVRRSRLFGVEWNVDHIVPLKSTRVCGLHVEHNLQVIPRMENIRKGNRLWPDMG